MEIDDNETHTIQARFVSDNGDEAGPPLDLPVSVDISQMELILNALLKNVSYSDKKYFCTISYHLILGRHNTISLFHQ